MGCSFVNNIRDEANASSLILYMEKIGLSRTINRRSVCGNVFGGNHVNAGVSHVL